jgi:hypothetical protein
MLTLTICIFSGLLVHVALADGKPSTDTLLETDPTIVQEKDRQLREMQKRERERWERRQAEEKERGRELLRQEEEERRLRQEAQAGRLEAVDPLLRKAWLGYSDYDNRDREQVKQMFEEYLKRNPDSPFAPEIYYRIGSMYSNKAMHSARKPMPRARSWSRKTLPRSTTASVTTTG